MIRIRNRTTKNLKLWLPFCGTSVTAMAIAWLETKRQSISE